MFNRSPENLSEELPSAADILQQTAAGRQAVLRTALLNMGYAHHNVEADAEAANVVTVDFRDPTAEPDQGTNHVEEIAA